MAQTVITMASSVWLTCSTEQPGRSGNNVMRDIDSFLEKQEIVVGKLSLHSTTFSCTEDDTAGEPPWPLLNDRTKDPNESWVPGLSVRFTLEPANHTNDVDGSCG